MRLIYTILFAALALALSTSIGAALYGGLRPFVEALRRSFFSWDLLDIGPFASLRLQLWLLLSVGASWGLYHILFN